MGGGPKIMLAGVTYWLRLFLSHLKNKKANRKNLSRLDGWFFKAGSEQDILEDFELDALKLGVLNYLAARPQGWYPPKSIFSDPPKNISRELTLKLVLEGLIHIAPFKNKIRLSDSGRYILILCAETIEINAKNGENNNA
jgi:hypothetical protein